MTTNGYAQLPSPVSANRSRPNNYVAKGVGTTLQTNNRLSSKICDPLFSVPPPILLQRGLSFDGLTPSTATRPLWFPWDGCKQLTFRFVPWAALPGKGLGAAWKVARETRKVHLDYRFTACHGGRCAAALECAPFGRQNRAQRKGVTFVSSTWL